MKPRPRTVPHQRSRVVASLVALTVAGVALGAPACGSSSSNEAKLVPIPNLDGGGTGGAGSGSGGTGSLFDPDSSFVADAQPPVIDPDAACATTSVVASTKKVNVLLVVDESRSMLDTPTGFASNKWTALVSALESSLGAVQNDLSFGLELFPYATDPKTPIADNCTTDCCQMPATPDLTVPVEAGKTAVPKITAALGTAKPSGNTPTATALSRAVDYFTTGAGASLEGDRYVLLATDGGPNCNSALTCDSATCTTNLDGKCTVTTGSGNCCDPQFGGAVAQARCLDDQATTQKLQALRTAGVKTFVVGIPGTEAYAQQLDAFAVAGGEAIATADGGGPRYYAVDAALGAAGLSDVLSSITKSLVTTCVLTLPSAPKDPDLVNVLVDKVRVAKNSNGWRIDGATITLLGSTCDKVQSEGVQSVQVLVECPKIAR